MGRDEGSVCQSMQPNTPCLTSAGVRGSEEDTVTRVCLSSSLSVEKVVRSNRKLK